MMAAKIHRFIGNFDLSKQEVVIRSEEIVNQIRNVLKLTRGESIHLSTGRGDEVEGEIESVSNDEVHIRITARRQNETDSIRRVSLYLAVLKGDHFDISVQKATEVGVTEIIPIITEHTVKQGVNKIRLERIAREAAELAGRSTIPQIFDPLTFSAALLRATTNGDMKIFFDKNEQSIFNVSAYASRIALFIGPEGGWTDEEKTRATQEGCIGASLGSLTFRGETAAIIASYLLCQQKKENNE